MPAHAIDIYQPEVDAKRFPNEPAPQSTVEITADVKDKFSEVKNATLTFSHDNWVTNSTVNMRLTSGTPTNGTYLGTITPQKVGTTIKYRIHIEDNLGYSFDKVDEYSISLDTTKPYFETPAYFPQDPSPAEDVRIRSRIQDFGSGIKNVTVYFSTGKDGESHLLPMSQVNGLVFQGIWDSVYEAYIPRQPVNTTVNLSVESYDYAGNHERASTRYDVRISDTKEVDFTVEINGLNIPHDAPAKMSVTGYLPTNYTVNFFPLQINGEPAAYIPFQNQRIINEPPISVANPIQLIGDPWDYPFDKYYTDLKLTIPIKDAKVNLPNNISVDDKIRDFWNVKVGEEKVYNDGDNTVLDFRITVTRNLSGYAVIVPLIGSFFLLGSIFMLGNDSEDISKRLVISVGIFALLFGFTPFLYQMKPYSFGLPTIAEISFGLLIFSTISYTIITVVVSKQSTKITYFYEGLTIFIMSTFALGFLGYPSEDVGNARWLTVIGLAYGYIVRFARWRYDTYMKTRPARFANNWEG